MFRAHSGIPTVLLSAILTASTASAAVLEVPTDHATIQGAIDVASPGDTVRVAPGTYLENLDFLGKAITVESSGGAAVTTVDAGQVDTVVTIDSGEGTDSVLRGFTITGGRSFGGGGINVRNASPTIEDNIITQNTACGGGSGIQLRFSSAIVRGNIISQNGLNNLCSSGSGGGGVRIGGAGSALLENNDIVDNSQRWGAGIALFAAGTPTLRGNLIARNTASRDGGGMDIVNRSPAIITDNLFVDNSAGEFGGGIHWLVPSGTEGPKLVGNTFVDNTAVDEGPALAMEGFDTDTRVAGNIFVSQPGQDVVYCELRDQVPEIIANLTWSIGGTSWTGTCGDFTGVDFNIAQDPLFIDALNGDLHLQLSSPAIDAGDDLATELGATDFDGAPRRQDGDGDGVNLVDMGAFEAPDAGVSCQIDDDFEDGSLDSSWTLVGLGNANQESVLEANGELALTADGATAFFGADNGGFLYQQVTGDFRIETTVDGSTMTTGGAFRKSGLAMRAGLDPWDARVMALLVPFFADRDEPHLQFIARQAFGQPGRLPVARDVVGVPRVISLAIERSGDDVRVEYSLDGGLTWIQPTTGLGGSIDIPTLPQTVYVGLIMVSNNISVTSTALYEEASICPLP